IAERDAMRVQLIAPDGAPAQLTIVSAPLLAEALRCSGPVDVEVRNVANGSASAPMAFAAALSDSAQHLTFYGDMACGVPLTALQSAGSHSSASLYVPAARPGQTELNVHAPWLRAALQLEQFQSAPDSGMTPDAGPGADAGMTDAGGPGARVGPWQTRVG